MGLRLERCRRIFEDISGEDVASLWIKFLFYLCVYHFGVSRRLFLLYLTQLGSFDTYVGKGFSVGFCSGNFAVYKQIVVVFFFFLVSLSFIFVNFVVFIIVRLSSSIGLILIIILIMGFRFMKVFVSYSNCQLREVYKSLYFRICGLEMYI